MKSINILKKTLVALTLTLATTGAFTTKAEAKLNKIKVTSPSGKTVRVAKGKKVKLKTTVKKLKNKKVKFKSKNPKVARVTAKGFVKGIKKGKTKIVVSSKSNPKIKKTMKVVVYKKPVKKIKLNKKKVNLETGQQFKLTASISPKKNVSKVLSYKSSNKKVATVTKKGIIKAVAAGTAKITVKATDGSKKKATCLVTVKKGKAGIKSVEVRSAFSLNVELTRAKALTYEDFTILCKYPNEKEFLDVFEITSLTTLDNIHYEVVIRDNKMFDYKSILKVVIKNLEGVHEKDIYVDGIYGHYNSIFNRIFTCHYSKKVNSRDLRFFYEVGKKISYRGDFEEFNMADIKKITVSELPKGLTATYAEDNSYFEFNGTFAEKTYEHKTVVTAIDANDKKILINCYFYIGDKDTLYVKAFDVKSLSYVPGESELSEEELNKELSWDMGPDLSFTEQNSYIHSCKKYKAEGLPDNTYIADDGHLFLKDISKPVKAGVYNITLSAVTQTGKNFTVKYKLTLVDGIKVKGRLTDPDGKPLSSMKINFVEKFDAKSYEEDDITETDENGYYQIRIIPGTYDIRSDRKNVYNSYYVELTKDTTLNIKSLYYKIVFANPVLDSVADSSDIIVLDEEDNSVYDMKGKENVLISKWFEQNNRYEYKLFTYLKKGTYNFGDGVLKLNRFINDEESYNVLNKQFTVSESGTVKLDLEKVE